MGAASAARGLPFVDHVGLPGLVRPSNRLALDLADWLNQAVAASRPWVRPRRAADCRRHDAIIDLRASGQSVASQMRASDRPPVANGLAEPLANTSCPECHR
jgi:hypothetical protein